MNIKAIAAVTASVALAIFGSAAAFDMTTQAAEANAPAYATSSTSFACGNIMQEWELTVDDTLPQEAIDAMIDGACEAISGHYQQEPERYTSVLTCFDSEGMVTTGDNWRECFPMNVKG